MRRQHNCYYRYCRRSISTSRTTAKIASPWGPPDNEWWWKSTKIALDRSNSASGSVPVLAIRRETQSAWERRAPLAPHHVKALSRAGIKVLIQPSNRRAYPIESYTSAGAIVQEDITEASLITGIKQPPSDGLIPNKTYLFFSHTHKAQADNMGLLDAILDNNIRLIDYEKMVDAKNQRVVAFGKYAGVAGMINILHGLGLRLLALGHHTPFMNVGLAHNYRNSGMARQAIRDVGYQISLGLMPKSIGPLTFVFTGTGNVSQGAQEVFSELPHEYVDPETLPKIAEYGSTSKVYACVVSREHHLVNKDTGKYSSLTSDSYETHPGKYVSTFSKKIAPYASVIVNGIYWAPNSLKLVTIPDAKTLLRPSNMPWIKASPGCPTLPHRLLAICDISADPGGSIEFMSECTTIDKPFCLYDADQNKNTESFTGIGVLVCSIDNMPTQLPLEATDFFGGVLLPFIPEMVRSDATKPFEDFQASDVIKNAVIASNGKLTPKFSYIEELKKSKRDFHFKKGESGEQPAKPKVLILGAGYVSAPVVEYLTRDNDYNVSIVSPWRRELDRLTHMHNKSHSAKFAINPIVLDIERNTNELEGLIKEHNIVVSLLPYNYHPAVARLCIKNRKNLVTTSYVSGDMKGLAKSAEEAGISIVNECGLDPGIDHMLAMEVLDQTRQTGSQVMGFSSFCGGLPAPEFADNPLRYKFSWYPKGVLLSSLAGAKYLANDQVIEIPANGSLMNDPKDFPYLPAFNLECYPNRDSTIYLEEYKIPKAHTLIRGTLRYKGFCNAMKGIQMLGLMAPQDFPLLHPSGPEISWRTLICKMLDKPSDILLDTLKNEVFERVGKIESRVDAIENLGLLSDLMVDKRITPLDTLSNYLAQTLSYGKNEKDLIILRHSFDIRTGPQAYEAEERTVTLIVYGEPGGHTAMAKTVGFPCAIAVKMVLEGEIQTKGLVMPLTPDIYRPILERLKKEGIEAVTKIIPATNPSHPHLAHVVG